MFTKSAAYYDALYGFKNYRAEAEKLRTLIGSPTPDATLLDVACGTGKHLEYLRQWYTVEGLDLDPELLNVARQRLPGVPLHLASMEAFDLERRFDVVVCLFSSIGYTKTEERLHRAVGCLAKHVAPGGLLIVEPWLMPDDFHAGYPHALFVDEPQLKLCRLSVSAVQSDVSIHDFHYLVATPAGVQHFTERHELGLFSDDQYRDAFVAAGLQVEHDPEGLTGRGLYLARSRPAASG